MRIIKLTLLVALLFMGVSTAFSQELFDAIKNNDLPKVKNLLSKFCLR